MWITSSRIALLLGFFALGVALKFVVPGSSILVGIACLGVFGVQIYLGRHPAADKRTIKAYTAATVVGMLVALVALR